MPDHPTALSGVRLGPVTLHGATIVLRPPRIDDYSRWRQLRLYDRHRIEPFWSSSPLDWSARHTPRHWIHEYLSGRVDEKAGRRLGLVIEVDGLLAGQVELAHVDFASGSAELGLWLSSQLARRGIAVLATALTVDFAFGPAGLRRITAPISPDNLATSAGAQQLGFRREALMARYFDVGGTPRDHELWAITDRAAPREGLTANWIRRRSDRAPREAPPPPDLPEVPSPRRSEILVAIARYHAGRLLRPADPLWSAQRVRLTDPRHPGVVVRNIDSADHARRAAGLRRVGADFGVVTANDPGRRARRTFGLVRPRPGTAAPPLLLTIEADGAYAGEVRLFEADMFNRHARLFAWTDPALPAATLRRIRTVAIGLVVEYALADLRLVRVAAEIEPDDTEAAEIAARAGMAWEGRMRDFVGVTGHRADHDLWAVTVPDSRTARRLYRAIGAEGR
ncbi:GNAT family protein [Nocardia sp. NPDC005366]|uniref:GNAT family N-acetyltransferase n=1 Tax=Nocardia sp. NPDC005366 TaxID=3156878 RepID=UPI0033B4E797